MTPEVISNLNGQAAIDSSPTPRRRWTTRIAALVGAGALALSTAAPAMGQVEQDGLVNVNIGDVTILKNVNVALGATVAANICGVQVGPVVALAQEVDADSQQRTVCEANAGEVTISQNTSDGPQRGPRGR